MKPGHPVSAYGGRLLDPNAHRCLHQARIHLGLAWQCIRSALRWQLVNPDTRRAKRGKKTAVTL